MSKVQGQSIDRPTSPSLRRREADERLTQTSNRRLALKHYLRLWPYPVSRLNTRLSEILPNARLEGGFYIPNFAAKRALGDKLLININPASVRRFLDDRILVDGIPMDLAEYFIGGGDWSDIIMPLRTSSTHREVYHVARHPELDFRETRPYARALSRLEKGKPYARNFITYRTKQEVDAYFGDVVKLIESIRSKGVLPRTRAKRHRNTKLQGPRNWWVEAFEADIGVAITRRGTIVRFASGKHRTAAAMGLGLKSIPVEVRMVHASWLQAQIERTGLQPVDALFDGMARLEALAQPSGMDSP
jgi:hypothetical protein